MFQVFGIPVKTHLNVMKSQPPVGGLGTGEGWAGVIPPGQKVGVTGAAPCVGVILIPPTPDKPTIALHFTATTDVGVAFEKLGAWGLRGYKAVLSGAMNNQDYRRTLGDVVAWLWRRGYDIQAYVPSTLVYVDADGNLYWTQIAIDELPKYLPENE